MKKSFLLLLFLYVLGLSHAQSIVLDTSWRHPVPIPNEMVYWFDQDHDSLRHAPLQNGAMLLDVSSLPVGVHTLHCYLTDNAGNAYPTYSSVFFCPPTLESFGNDTVEAHEFVYWFDQDHDSLRHAPLQNGAMLLDVSSLPVGVHTLHCYLTDNAGNAYPTYSSVFFCPPTLESFGQDTVRGIAEYYYWLNDDMEHATHRVVSPVANPFQWTELIEVEAVPFRSSNFHFEIDTNQQPHAYAKTMFTSMFFDGHGHFVSDSMLYVDYRVEHSIIADTILPNTQESFARVANNDIKWFKLTAQKGELLEFKSNLPCTIQLFDPQGQEIYFASDAGSTRFDGTHAWHDGTYYLAVHDVTTYGTIQSVEYQHINKFAVISQDANRVGNGGLSAITFGGNGFDSLLTVLAVHGTDTLHCHYQSHDSRISVMTVFDFEGVDTAVYSLVFYFAGETIVLPNALTVETAKDIILTSNVDFPNSFLRGSTVTYTLEVTNTGNMTAFYVPLYVYIESNDLNDISKIDLEGFKLKSLVESIESDTLTSAERYEIEKIESNIGDGYRLMQFQGYDSVSCTNKAVHSNYFMITMAPYETKTITVTLESTEAIEVWFTIPDTVQTIRIIYAQQDNLSKGSICNSKSSSILGYVRDQYCCLKEHISCALDIGSQIVDIADLLAPAFGLASEVAIDLAGCVVGALDMSNDVLSKVLCDNEDDDMDNFFENWSKIMDMNSVYGTIISCLKRFVPKAELLDYLEKTNKAANIAGVSLGNTVYKCKKAFSQKEPGCPPTPPKGGRSNPTAPVDPNEIIGYVAESGSKYIPAGVESVTYEVECENEASSANAAVHKMTIVDTLSPTFFDLTSLASVEVTIGDRRLMLDGSQNYVRTIDLRPNINALAEVSQSYDTTTGIIRWNVITLDPLTLAPTTDPLVGVLPPNTDGSGRAAFLYRINLKQPLVDGRAITNQAHIVFDYEDPIATPVWTNIVDAIPPTSSIVYGDTDDNSTIFTFQSSDNRSGVWHYELYGRENEMDEWHLVANNIEDNVCVLNADTLNTDFYVIAMDSAGNHEVKNPQVEYNKQNGVTHSTTTYTVSFLNYNGLELQQYRLAPGMMPTYVGSSPTRIGDDHYTYHFKGWSPTLTTVTSNQTYYAMYDTIPNVFRICFYDYDSTLLETDSIPYGMLPHYEGNIPMRPTLDTFRYAFVDWTPTLTTVVGDAEYYPLFDSVTVWDTNSYIVTFTDWNDEVLQTDRILFGNIPYYWSDVPTRVATLYYQYQFVGWSSSLMPVTHTVTYKAIYDSTAITYPVIFANYNGVALQRDTLPYGAMPQYQGITPAKRSTQNYRYIFIGWQPLVDTVIGNALYTAVYDSVVRQYVVTFADWDGSILQQDSVAYGTVPAYSGSIPMRPATAQYNYMFSHWIPEIIAVSEDAIYQAQYDSVVNQYTLALFAENGMVTGAGVYDYGSEIVIEAIPNDGYRFQEWNDGNTDNPRTIVVINDIELTALFEQLVGIDTYDGFDRLRAYAKGSVLYVDNAEGEVLVYDMVGRRVYRGNDKEIQLLASGIYIVVARNGAVKVPCIKE